MEQKLKKYKKLSIVGASIGIAYSVLVVAYGLFGLISEVRPWYGETHANPAMVFFFCVVLILSITLTALHILLILWITKYNKTKSAFTMGIVLGSFPILPAVYMVLLLFIQLTFRLGYLINYGDTEFILITILVPIVAGTLFITPTVLMYIGGIRGKRILRALNDDVVVKNSSEPPRTNKEIQPDKPLKPFDPFKK